MHNFQKDAEGDYHVGVYHSFDLSSLINLEAIGMYDPHLLDNGGLP
jgi:hypothetical protein